MAMRNVNAGVLVEPGTDRQDAGLDHSLVGFHLWRRRIGIVDGKLIRASVDRSSDRSTDYRLQRLILENQNTNVLFWSDTGYEFTNSNRWSTPTYGSR
jgi:hypothetical protein